MLDIWSMEESRPRRVVTSRPVHLEMLHTTGCNSVGSAHQTSAVFNDILQVISPQDKGISEQDQNFGPL